MANAYGISDVQAYLKQAADAEAAGDYAGAFRFLSAAQTLLAGIPDGSRGFAGGSQSVTFTRQAIDDAISRVTKLANAKAGIQTSKILTCPVRTSAANYGSGLGSPW